jgi:hypothetical protein
LRAEPTLLSQEILSLTVTVRVPLGLRRGRPCGPFLRAASTIPEGGVAKPLRSIVLLRAPLSRNQRTDRIRLCGWLDPVVSRRARRARCRVEPGRARLRRTRSTRTACTRGLVLVQMASPHAAKYVGAADEFVLPCHSPDLSRRPSRCPPARNQPSLAAAGPVDEVGRRHRPGLDTRPGRCSCNPARVVVAIVARVRPAAHRPGLARRSAPV